MGHYCTALDGDKVMCDSIPAKHSTHRGFRQISLMAIGTVLSIFVAGRFMIKAIYETSNTSLI